MAALLKTVYPNDALAATNASKFKRYEGEVVPVHIHLHTRISDPIPMLYAGTRDREHAWFITEQVTPAQGEVHLRGIYTQLGWVRTLEGSDSFLLYDLYECMPGKRVTGSDTELERIVKLWRNRTVNKHT